jgi:hypothetical protein
MFSPAALLVTTVEEADMVLSKISFYLVNLA